MGVIFVHFTKLGGGEQVWKRVRRKAGSEEDYMSIKCINTVCIPVVYRLDGAKTISWGVATLFTGEKSSYKFPATLREIRCEITLLKRLCKG